MLTDNDINKLIADPECWDGRGLGARFDKVAFARKVEAMAMAAERERLCAAIKAEDDYCVTEGDYMLDSDDCIRVIRGAWVRPDYTLTPSAPPA